MLFRLRHVQLANEEVQAPADRRPGLRRFAFYEDEGPIRSYWEGRGHFDPLDACIEYFVHANEADPGASQRAVYRRIAENYRELLSSVTSTCAAGVYSHNGWHRRPHHSSDLQLEFSLYPCNRV